MDGHFDPLTGIAMHFKAKGHDVRWYCSQALKGKNYLLLVATGNINTEKLRKKYNLPNIIIEDFIDFDFIRD